MFNIVVSLHSNPESGILRESSLGLFDPIHNKNAGSYSPSGSPREIWSIIAF